MAFEVLCLCLFAIHLGAITGKKTLADGGEQPGKFLYAVSFTSFA
jgi:hypothetical protein